MRTFRASLAAVALAAVALLVPTAASAAPLAPSSDTTVDVVVDAPLDTLAVQLNYGWNGN